MLTYDTPAHITAFSTTRDGEVSVDIPCLVMPLHQTHGIVTRVIDEAFLRLNPVEQALALDGVDAIATHLPQLCVCVRTADCVPILLWDDRAHTVSAVHAGWRGTLQRIAQCHIDTLRDTYGTHPQDLHAIIGPSIGPDSFEVGEDVYDLFARGAHTLPASRHPASPIRMESSPSAGAGTRQSPSAGAHWFIDLWECNRQQLIASGVRPDRIHLSGIDTFAHHDQFCSARRGCQNRIINGIMRSE